MIMGINHLVQVKIMTFLMGLKMLSVILCLKKQFKLKTKRIKNQILLV